MALETGTYISDLVTANPTATDPKSQGDDHIRFLKSTIKSTFPNVNGLVTATQTDLNSITSKANIASPELTGIPTAPTATPGNSTNQLATCAYVASVAIAGALTQAVPTALVFTSSTTWTVPDGVIKAKVTVTGGGGSAGNSNASQASGGGGGGGTAIKYLTVIPGTVYTATIGAGGVAIASGAASATGNTGGTSTFAGAGITTISASGGLGGPASGRGGLGGATFSGDDISIIGGVGLSAVGNNSTPPPHGGSSYWAGISPDGVAGVGFGNGGGGKWANTGGPAGAAGVVVVEF